MDKMKIVKDKLMDSVQSLVYGDLKAVDSKELGEAIDMVKDLSEAIYYCTVTEAMSTDKYKEKENGRMYYGDYNPTMYTTPYYSPTYTSTPPMMYGGNGGPSPSYNMGGSSGRDYREGQSQYARKMYMEGKELHLDKTKQMQELEKYVQELTKDLTEMVRDASPEEKMLLQQKVATLASKIN